MNLNDEILSGLSEETMKALREFALSSGIALGEEGLKGDSKSKDAKHDLIENVTKHFQVQDRDEVFPVKYISKDGRREVSFKVKGIKRELGQTLSSTGLTM
jgi:hypothetical protein